MPLRNIPNSISSLNEKLRNKGSKLPDHVFMNLLGSTEYQDNLKMTTVDDLDITDDEIDLAIQEAGGQGYEAKEIQEDVVDSRKEASTPAPGTSADIVVEQPTTPAGMITDESLDTPKEAEIDIQPQEELTVKEPYQFNLDIESNPELYEQFQISIAQEASDAIKASMSQDGTTTVVTESEPIFKDVSDDNTTLLRGQQMFPVFDEAGNFLGDDYFYDSFTITESIDGSVLDGDIEGISYITLDGGYERLTQGGVSTKHIAIGIDSRASGDRALMHLASLLGSDSSLELLSTDELENKKKEFLESKRKKSEYAKTVGQMSAVEEIQYYLDEFRKINAEDPEKGRVFLENVMNNTWIKDSEGMFLYKEIQPGTSTTIGKDNINPVLAQELMGQGVLGDTDEGSYRILPMDQYVSSLNLEGVPEGITPFAVPYDIPGLSYDNVNLDEYDRSLKSSNAQTYVSLRTDQITELDNYGIQFLTNTDERVREMEHVLDRNGYVPIDEQKLQALKDSDAFVAQRAYEFISKNYDLESGQLKGRQGYELLYLSPMLFQSKDLSRQDAQKLERELGIEITAGTTKYPVARSYTNIDAQDVADMSPEEVMYAQSALSVQSNQINEAIQNFAETGELVSPEGVKDILIPSGQHRLVGGRKEALYKNVPFAEGVMYYLNQIDADASKPSQLDVADLQKMLTQDLRIVSLYNTDENGDVSLVSRVNSNGDNVVSNFSVEQNREFWEKGWLPIDRVQFQNHWYTHYGEANRSQYDSNLDDGTEGTTYWDQVFDPYNVDNALYDYTGSWYFPDESLLGQEEDITLSINDARLNYMNLESTRNNPFVKQRFIATETEAGVPSVEQQTFLYTPTEYAYLEDASYNQTRVNNLNFDAFIPAAYRPATDAEKQQYEAVFGRPMPQSKIDPLTAGYEVFISNEPGMLITPDGNSVPTTDLQTRTTTVRGKEYEVGGTGADMEATYRLYKEQYPNPYDFAKEWYAAFFKDLDNTLKPPSLFVAYEKMENTEALQSWYIQNGYMNDQRSVATFRQAPGYQRYPLLAEFQPGYLGRMLTSYDGTAVQGKKDPILMELDIMEANLESGVLADIIETLRSDPKLVEERKLAEESFNATYSRIVDLQTLDEPRYKQHFKRELEYSCRVKAAGVGSCYIVRMENGVERAMNYDEFYMWKKDKGFKYDEADVRMFNLEGAQSYGLVRWGSARLANLGNGLVNFALTPFSGFESIENDTEVRAYNQQRLSSTTWGQTFKNPFKSDYIEIDYNGETIRAIEKDDQLIGFSTPDGVPLDDFSGDYRIAYEGQQANAVRSTDYSGKTLLSQTVDVTGDLAILISLSMASGGVGASLGGAEGAMILSRFTSFITTTAQTYNGQYNAAINGGSSKEGATSYAALSAMSIGAINLFTPGLEKTVLSKLDDVVLKSKVPESSQKAILSALNQYKSSLSIDDFMLFAKEWGKAGFEESIQEVVLEGISDEIFQTLILPESVDKAMFKTAEEAVMEGIISFIVSGPVALTSVDTNPFQVGYLQHLAVTPESSIAKAKGMMEKGKITEEQLQTVTEYITVANSSLKEIRSISADNKIDGVFESVYEYQEALYKNEKAPEGEPVFSEEQLQDLKSKYEAKVKETEGYTEAFVESQEGEMINDDQFLDMYMNGKISNEIVKHISAKLYRGQELTAREEYVYSSRKDGFDKIVGNYVLSETLNQPIISKVEGEPLAPVTEGQQEKLTTYFDVLMGARKAATDPENASDQDREYADIMENAGVDVTNPEYSMTLTGVEFESLFDNDAIELDQETALIADLDVENPTDDIQDGEYVVVYKNTLKFDPLANNNVNTSKSNTKATLSGTIRVDDVQTIYKRTGKTLTLVYNNAGFVANDGMIQNPVSGKDIQKNTDPTATEASKELGVETEVIENPTQGDLTIDPGTQSEVFVLDMSTADLQQAINNGNIPDGSVFRMFNGKIAKGTKYIVVGKGMPQFVAFDEGQDQAGYFESNGNARAKVSTMSYYDIYRVNEDGSVSKVDYEAVRSKAIEKTTSDKIVEGLNESGMESVTELEELINNGQWGAFTAENPDTETLSIQENAERNERAKEWLKSRGYETIIDIQGQYGGNPEHSFLVPGMSRQDAIDFAEEFGQESVATNEGLIYRNGKVETRVDSPVETRAYGSFDDNYSTVKIGGKNVSFAANYQFGVKQNIAEWSGERVDPSEVFVPPTAQQNSPSSVDILTGVGTFAASPITTMPGSAVVKTPEGTRIVMRDLDEGVSELMSIYTPRSNRGQGNAASAVQGIVEGAEGSGNIIMTRLAGKDSYLEGMLLDNGFVKEGDVYVYTPSTYVAPVASSPDSRSNIRVTGTEEVVESSGTVGTAVKSNGTTLKTTDGAYFSSNEAYRQGASSAVVTEAMKLMSGEFTYTNSKGEVFTVKLPIVDKKLQTKIKSLRTRYKNATSKAQKDRLKLKLQEATEQAYNQVVEHAESMLQANLDIASPEFIEQGRQWYDGANRLAQGLASEYGISLDKSAAMIAALSPQNPWDNNLANAESLMSVLTLGSDITIDADVISQIESLRNNDKGKPRADVVSILNAIENFEGKTISELKAEGIEPRIIGVVARAIFQAEMQAEASEAGVSLSEYLRYPQYRADGSFFEMSNSRESLGSFGELGKAIEIFFLTDESKITSMLGNGNKVRNFYNNIVNPNSAEGYVTIDTHATAIALGVPMGSNAVGGLGVFKGGPSYTYSAIAEAYRNVAARNGMLPRELQSVVWTMAQSGIHADNNKYENYRERVTEIFSGEGTIADKARAFVEGVEFVEPRWLDGTGVSLTTLPKVRPTNESDANQATRGESDSGIEGDVGIGESSPTDVVVQPTEQVKPTENDTKNKIQPGTNLYGQSVPAVENIKNQYNKQQFGESAPEYTGEQTLNESEQRDLGQAYDEMENAFDDPEVVAAYELWAEETLAQYEAMIAAGYEIVIDHDEPYANAQELVEDVRNNRRLKIFSTESGYGDGITDEMRSKDVRLRPSGFFDKNGKPLLINDVFRGVHDFFGHGVLGNNFSALGEEVAFQVHSRMYSDGAIGPLVSEARAQNAWINFYSEQTQEFYELEAEQDRLEAEGRLDEARLLDPLIQQAVTYPTQKFNILPKRFWNVDRSNTGAFEKTGRVQQQAVEQQDVLSKWKRLGLGGFDGDPRILGKPQSIPGNSPQVSARAMDVLVDRLMESGLATNVTTDKASWEKAVNDHFSKKDRGRMAKLPDGTIYGFINNSGEVFLNPEIVRASTPIHEFGHLWAIALKNSDPEAYQAALDVMKNTPYHKAVKADPLYSDLSETDPNSTEILEEALANAIADHGEKLIKEGAKKEFGEIEEDISEAVYEKLENVFASPQFEMLLGAQLSSLDSSPNAETVAKKAAAEILGGKQETKNQEVPKSPEDQVGTTPPVDPPTEPTEGPSEEGPEATYRTLERALAKAEQEGNEELAEEYRKAVNEGRPIVATEKVVQMRDNAMDQLKKSPDFDGAVERILFDINQTTQQELIDKPHLSSYQAALLDAIASYYEDMGKTKKAVEVRTAQARISSNAGRTLQAFGNTQVTNLPTLDKMKSDNKANKNAYGKKMDGNEDAVNEAMAEAAPTQAEVKDASNSDNVNKAVERAYKKARKATDSSRRTNEQRYDSAIKSAKKNAAKVDGDPTQSDKFMGNVRSAVQAAFNMEAESKSGNLQQNLDNIAEELNIPNSVVNEIANETAKQKVAEGASLPEVKAAINDIIYNHYFDRQGDSRSIADKIVDAIPGMSTAEANAIVNSLTAQIVEAIEKKVRKAHERMLDIAGTPKKNKPLNVSDNKKYGKLILALAQGGFSNQTVVDNSDIAPALAEYFGIEVLNDNEIAKLETMIYEYMNLDEGERKQRRLRDINNYIQNVKTSNMAHLLSGLVTDIMYANALSGFSTMERATLGGLQTSLMQVVFDAIAGGMGAGMTTTLEREGSMPVVVAGGVLDQARGILDALVSLIPNLHELALQRKVGGFISTMLDGYSPLEFADGRDPGVESLLDNIINNNPDFKNADSKTKEAIKLAIKIHMFPAVYASRFLPAIDGILRDQIMSYAERQQVRDYLVKRGYNTFSIDMYNQLNEIRGKRDMEEIYERVDEEIDDMIQKGEKVPFGYRDRRAEEIRKQRTQERLENDDLIEQQKDFAASSLLMGNPEGRLGQAYDFATKNLTIRESDSMLARGTKIGLRTIFLFLKVPTNFINMTLDYSPYGMYRGLRGDTRVKGGDRRMYTDTESARRVLQSGAGMLTGLALFARAFDYDDEGKLKPNLDFEIFGEKPDRLRWSDKRNLGRKYSEMSIKVGDQYYSFVDNPMGIWLAPIAYMQDDLRSDKDTEYDPVGVMMYYSQGMGKFGFSQSYSQGINDLIRIVESVGDPEAMAEISQKRGESTFDLLTVSNLRRQTVKIWNDINENPEKTDLDFIQKRLGNYPMLMAVTAPEKVDQFGNPVDVDFETGYFLGEFVDAIDKYMTEVETKEYREWALLEKFPDVFVGYRNTTMWKEEELDQEKESFLRRETAFAFGDLVRENIDKLEQIEESEDLDRELKELFSEAKETANVNFYEAYPEFTYEALVNYEGWDPFGGIDFDEAQQYYSVLKSFDGGMERFRERYYEPVTMKGYEFTVAESETIKSYASVHFGENILQAKDMLEDPDVSIGAKNDIIDKYWSVGIKQAKADWVSQNPEKFSEGVEEAAIEKAETYQEYQNRMRNRNE